MRLTLARSTDYDGLYVDGVLARQCAVVDIEDLFVWAGKEPFTLVKKYMNEEWVRQTGYNLPLFEKDLVELDS
jgi:hypothetical protein